MVIGITAGTPVQSGGTTYVASQNVSTPALTTGDIHVIVVSIVVGGGSPVATLTGAPTNYTQLTNGYYEFDQASNAAIYVFYRQATGSVSSGTATVTASGSQTAKFAVVPFTITGADTTTPFQISGNQGGLGAPTLTPATSDKTLITFHGNRESNSTPSAGFTWTAPSGMSNIGSISSTTSNGGAQVGAGSFYLTLSSTSATGTKTATTSNTASPAIAGSISVLVTPAVAGNTAPSAPLISATPGDTQNVINWTAPNNGGSAITGYTLQRRSPAGSGTFTTINSPAAGATSFTDTGRTNGTSYGYQLSATNAIGTSAYSNEASATPTAAASTGYTAIVLATNPAHYYPLNTTNTTTDIGNAATKINATNNGGVTFDSTTVNGTSVDSARFSGSNYLQLANSQDFSVTKTKELTIMCHLIVDDYDTYASSSQYTHYMGKGDSANNSHEWTMRAYQTTTSDNRPKRHSCYYYLPAGGQGNGSYAQPNLAGAVSGEINLTAPETATLAIGQEHVVIAQYWTTGSGSAPGGIKIWYNGRNCDTDTMSGGTAPAPGIIPQWTTEPVRIGRREAGASSGSLKGRIRRVGFWNRLLSSTEIGTLTNTTNRALSEGASGSGTTPSPPSQPVNVQGVRNTSINAVATVTWEAPLLPGSSAVTGYIVTHDNGGAGSPVVSAVLGSGVRSYDLTALPNVTVTVQVVARNAVGDSTPGVDQIPPNASLPLIGTLSDNFNANPYANRVFQTGVSQINNQLELTPTDATPRGTYIRGDFRSQAMFYKMTPSTTTNAITCMYVRSTSQPTRQIRIAVLNGTIIGRFDDGSPDASSSTRVFSAVNDKYWRISHDGTNILLQTSPNATTWNSLARSNFAAPTWLNDVQAGIETYINTSL